MSVRNWLSLSRVAPRNPLLSLIRCISANASTRPGNPTSTSAPASSSETTVNASEIAHFSRLSSQWWDERGEFAMLHKMNPVRVSFVRERVVRTRQDEGEMNGEAIGLGLGGMNALDVGCGGGLLSEVMLLTSESYFGTDGVCVQSLARLGAHTLAIDASEANIKIASAHAAKDPFLSAEDTSKGRPLTYRHATAHDLVQEGRNFDLVCSLEVVEHVDNPAEFLESCAALVKVILSRVSL